MSLLSHVLIPGVAVAYYLLLTLTWVTLASLKQILVHALMHAVVSSLHSRRRKAGSGTGDSHAIQRQFNSSSAHHVLMEAFQDNVHSSGLHNLLHLLDCLSSCCSGAGKHEYDIGFAIQNLQVRVFVYRYHAYTTPSLQQCCSSIAYMATAVIHCCVTEACLP